MKYTIKFFHNQNQRIHTRYPERKGHIKTPRAKIKSEEETTKSWVRKKFLPYRNKYPFSAAKIIYILAFQLQIHCIKMQLDTTLKTKLVVGYHGINWWNSSFAQNLKCFTLSCDLEMFKYTRDSLNWISGQDKSPTISCSMFSNTRYFQSLPKPCTYRQEIYHKVKVNFNREQV